jgi:hypothetical protein
MVPRAEIDRLRAEAEARGKTALKLWQREWMASWDAFLGQVFDMFDPSVHVVSEHPQTYRRVVLGKDWGFSDSHPGGLTTWLETDYGWHCADEVRATHQTVESYWVPRVVEQTSTWRVAGKPAALFCDPARPDHIQTMRNEQKGRWHTFEANNSVMEGIVTCCQWLEGRGKQKRITVHRKCESLIRELPTYQWEQTADGQSREKPRKAADDMVDSMRYALHSAATVHGVSYR